MASISQKMINIFRGIDPPKMDFPIIANHAGAELQKKDIGKKRKRIPPMNSDMWPAKIVIFWTPAKGAFGIIPGGLFVSR